MSMSFSGSAPSAYDRYLVPAIFRPYAEDLARRARARNPRRVLELAAGTGAVTREMHDLDVVATDLSDDMAAVGRTNAPNAEWRTADATSLPFGDGEFDLVVCQFGLMLFPDRRAAFAEARRVGGAMVFNVWGTIGENAFAAATAAGLERALGADAPPFLAAPYGYNDLTLVETEVRSGGFEDVTIETVVADGRAPSARDVATGYMRGTPMAAALAAAGRDVDAVLDIVTAEMEERLGAGEVTGILTAHVVEAA
jgi:SAM-dependent methyltransferase